jgi:orotate phosphoribosyltransferase
MKLAEGTDVTGRNVLIVEDVITTGGQVAISAVDLREAGAEIHSALCVIDRSDGNHDLDWAGIELRSLFRSADLEQVRPANSGDGP